MFRIFLLILLSTNLWAGTNDIIFKGGFEELFLVGGTTTTDNVTVKLNQFDDYIITTAGAYVIPFAVENGNDYQVTIVSNSSSVSCSIENNIGTINNSDVTDVDITCADKTTIYQVKQENVTGLVAIDNVLVTHCQVGFGFWVQTIAGDADYIGDDYSAGFVLKNGINGVDCSSDVKIGDRINIDSAYALDFFGQIELFNPITSLISENNSLPAPLVVNAADVGGLIIVPLEGLIVRVEGTSVTGIQLPAAGGESDPSNTIELDSSLIVDDRFHIASPFPIVGVEYVSVTGILGYRYNRMNLNPRNQADFVANVTDTTIYDVKQSNVTGLVSIDNVIVTHCQDGYGFWVQTIPGDTDYSGDDYSGGFVLKQDISCTGNDAVVNIGDRINLDNAIVSPFFQQIQLQYISSTVVSSNNILPTPVVAPVANLGGASVVPLEGVLVKVEDIIVTSIEVVDVSFEVDNTLVIDDRLFLVAPFPTIGFNYSSITGIANHSLGRSNLMPRFSQDIFESNGSATNLVINEVDYDQPQTDTQEFIEIFNPTSLPISLTNKVLYLIAGPTATSHVYAQYDLSSLGDLLSGQYLVVGSDLAIANTAVGALTMQLSGVVQNGSNDGMILVDTSTNTVIDGLSYEGNLDTVTLNDLGVTVNVTEGNSSLEDLNSKTASISRLPNGADTNDNDADWGITSFPTPGALNVFEDFPITDHLVINEFDYDQPFSDGDEFIEIFNPTNHAVDLNNKSVFLISGMTTQEYAQFDLDSLTSLPAGGYLVIGSSNVLDNIVALELNLTTQLRNTNNGIVLYDRANNSAIDSVSYEGNIFTATINGVSITVTEGNSSLEDSNAVGSFSRVPDGADTENNDNDFIFTTSATPGSLNIN